jgi:hypothetical protein
MLRDAPWSACGSRRRFSLHSRPSFLRITITETVVLKFTSALAQFRYRSRPESGGDCQRTLRRPLPHRKTSAADFYFGWAVLLPFKFAAQEEQVFCHRPPHLQSLNISKFLRPNASDDFGRAPYLSTLSLASRECKTDSVFQCIRKQCGFLFMVCRAGGAAIRNDSTLASLGLRKGLSGLPFAAARWGVTPLRGRAMPLPISGKGGAHGMA